MPTCPHHTSSATKALYYIFAEPMGTLEIYIENLADPLRFPANNFHSTNQANQSNETKGFIKIFGSVTAAALSEDIQLSENEILGVVSRTLRKISIRAQQLELYTVSGKKLAEIALHP